MRRWVERVVVVVALVAGSAAETPAQSVPPQPARWNSEGVIRVFEQNGARLLSGIYRTGGSDNGASTFTADNDLRLTNANSVLRMEATVTLLDAAISGSGFATSPRAGLEGFFYWNGTGTGTSSDQTGHVIAGINLALNFSTGLTEARYFVTRCSNADCSTSVTLATAALGPVNFFEPHRLRITYDGTSFAFLLDGVTSASFQAPDSARNAPTVPYKAVRTFGRVPASTVATLSLLALFDNLTVNDAPYETFDARSLPRVTIMPGSGTFTSTQVSDVVIAVETGGLAVASIKIFFDGADLSSLVSTLAPGTLAAGGITRRLANFPAAALPAVTLAGPHVVGVEVTFAGGAVARGHALWNVLPAIGP